MERFDLSCFDRRHVSGLVRLRCARPAECEPMSYITAAGMSHRSAHRCLRPSGAAVSGMFFQLFCGGSHHDCDRTRLELDVEHLGQPGNDAQVKARHLLSHDARNADGPGGSGCIDAPAAGNTVRGCGVRRNGNNAQKLGHRLGLGFYGRDRRRIDYIKDLRAVSNWPTADAGVWLTSSSIVSLPVEYRNHLPCLTMTACSWLKRRLW